MDQVTFNNLTLIKDKSLEETSLPQLGFRLWQALDQIQPDELAIAGYGRASMLIALLWASLNRKPAVLLSQTTEKDTSPSYSRRYLKQYLLSRYEAAFVGGKPQRRYLVNLGFPKDVVFPGYATVNNSVFAPESIRSLPHLLERPYFLAVNRFIAKKNLPFLLNAYHAYRHQAGNSAWDLVLCGDGKLRPQLEQQVAQLDLSQSVHLPGFLQQPALLPYFAHAHCFVHTSTQEQWGLVVNEAMAAGLPVLVSNACGCVEDLVIEGVTGFSFDPTNLEQLVGLMHKVSASEVKLQSMGQAALSHIECFSPDSFAQGMLQAADYALKQFNTKFK